MILQTLPLIKGFSSILLCIGIADLITGFFHWFEDRFGKPTHRFIGRAVIVPNLIHHFHPRHMTRHTWWQSADVLVLIAGTVALISWPLGLMSWQLGFTLLLMANANEVHKWAHRTKKENGRLISFLQNARLVQTPRHHNKHHQKAKDNHYCSLTNFLNPILDKLAFWRGLEKMIWILFKKKPRSDAEFREFAQI